MILTALREWLTEQAAITDLLKSPSAISTGKRDERKEPPYITLELSRSIVTMQSGSASTYHEAQIQVSCEHKEDTLAGELAEQVRDSLGAFGRGYLDADQTVFVTAITDLDISQRRETNVAGKDRYPAYNLQVTLDYTES